MQHLPGLRGDRGEHLPRRLALGHEHRHPAQRRLLLGDLAVAISPRRGSHHTSRSPLPYPGTSSGGRRAGRSSPPGEADGALSRRAARTCTDGGHTASPPGIGVAALRSRQILNHMPSGGHRTVFPREARMTTAWACPRSRSVWPPDRVSRPHLTRDLPGRSRAMLPEPLMAPTRPNWIICVGVQPAVWPVSGRAYSATARSDRGVGHESVLFRRP